MTGFGGSKRPGKSDELASFCWKTQRSDQIIGNLCSWPQRTRNWVGLGGVAFRPPRPLVRTRRGPRTLERPDPASQARGRRVAETKSRPRGRCSVFREGSGGRSSCGRWPRVATAPAAASPVTPPRLGRAAPR
ncbi:hypothetical protein P7K49_025201, partial [Saguinus oedipus]